MADGDRRPPRVQVIAERNAHVGLVGAILADRDARRKTHLGKVPVTIVLEKIIRAGIVGDEQIEGPVWFEVRPNGSKSKRLARAANSSLLGDVGESSVAIVVILGCRANLPGRAARIGH